MLGGISVYFGRDVVKEVSSAKSVTCCMGSLTFWRYRLGSIRRGYIYICFFFNANFIFLF